MQIYTSEESNYHSGAFVFLLGQLLSSIPFLFLISISSSLVFYFLIGLRDEFRLLMYFVLNFFMCLLVNEGLILVMASLWRNIFWIVLTLVSAHVCSLIQDLVLKENIYELLEKTKYIKHECSAIFVLVNFILLLSVSSNATGLVSNRWYICHFRC